MPGFDSSVGYFFALFAIIFTRKAEMSSKISVLLSWNSCRCLHCLRCGIIREGGRREESRGAVGWALVGDRAYVGWVVVVGAGVGCCCGLWSATDTAQFPFSVSRGKMDVLGGDLGMPRNASLPFIRSDPLSLPYAFVIPSLSILV
jgi:hypothetical protein